MSRGRWVVLSLVMIAAAALAIRLPQLGRRPMHCDEANQAAKAGLLLATGRYDYDPQDQHGPSLYWLTLPALRLRGVASFAASREADYRIVPVVFGVGMVLLLLLVVDGLGPGPTLAAGVLTALSPAMVYYSRDYIQETLLAFFTLAAIGCGWRWFRSGRWAWAIAAGASLGMMHATKETWVLSAAAMAVAVVFAGLWQRVFGNRADAPVGREMSRSRCGWQALAALAAAAFVAAAFYSSFGAQWSGPIDSLRAYASYLRRGSENGIHVHPWHFYLQLLTAYHPTRRMFWSEGFIVAMALVGLSASFGIPRTGLNETQRLFGRVLGGYTLALTAVYSAIPYKTPWCILSFLDGMILMAGLGAWAAAQWAMSVGRRSATAHRRCGLLPACVCLLLGAGTIHLAWECYMLNFRLDNDNDRNPYAYAQTSADAGRLAERIERIASASPAGRDMIIDVVTPANYWPLPWLLRRFNADRIGYWQDADAWRRDARRGPPPAVLIFSPALQATIDANLRAPYPRRMIYGLRPGVLLMVYAREP